MTPVTSDLECRIARLERTHRLLLCVLFLSVVVIGCAGIAGSGVVRAQAFELLTADGRVAGDWRVDESGPRWRLLDEAGVERVAVFLTPDATGVYVRDADSVTRIGIAQFAHGGGGVALHGPESKGAAVLYYKREGSLRFFDDEGQVTYEASGSGFSRDLAPDRD